MPAASRPRWLERPSPRPHHHHHTLHPSLHPHGVPLSNSAHPPPHRSGPLLHPSFSSPWECPHPMRHEAVTCAGAHAGAPRRPPHAHTSPRQPAGCHHRATTPLQQDYLPPYTPRAHACPSWAPLCPHLPGTELSPRQVSPAGVPDFLALPPSWVSSPEASEETRWVLGHRDLGLPLLPPTSWSQLCSQEGGRGGERLAGGCLHGNQAQCPHTFLPPPPPLPPAHSRPATDQGGGPSHPSLPPSNGAAPSPSHPPVPPLLRI